ncbi:tetratricopeptide repeat-containing protein [Sulfitobacter sp. SK012]|uniref:tetratricopeptide repeat protein n=1 Tax=Sulfitobacter sp. SK012 TaxID=1389005 RepID=UPI000E0C52B9|nr:tetratricopeptide repeat protein [Sulfitobacter sp. SK012]AXI47800.1 tetratricopeptide repeat-containing protein [Sulfitobacter sp. SK012]
MAGSEALKFPVCLRDVRGVPVSYADHGAIDGLERAVIMSLTFRGDAIAEIDTVLAEHPDFIMGWLFKAGWLTQAMETRIYDVMLESLGQAERRMASANDRERGHFEAIKAWVDGDFFGAVQKWEAVLTTYPMDLLALELVHYTMVLLGDVQGQRDVVARVFNLWDEDIPGYEFVLGFYSFGLEENRDFSRAEDMALQALSIRPDNPYAIHTVSHVMEMRGHQAGGIRFMKDRAGLWGTSNFANHLWWHTGLYHLDLEQYDQVYNIFDTQLDSRNKEGHRYEELDAAALLWRMNLVGQDSGDRWTHLANKWEPAAQDTLYAFNDVHAMLTFVSDDRKDAQKALLTANERYLESASDANTAMTREIGLPFCLAMRDFKDENYASCVERLLPVRYMTHRLGGSYAQRDIIGWTLLEAALRARNFDLALALANERTGVKPTSVQNWRAVARAFKGLGDHSNADRATAKAQAVIAS